MGLFGSLFRTKPRISQTPRFTPQQTDLQNQLLSQIAPLLSQLQQGAKPFDFAPIEQQARTGFRQTTIPSIMERFTNMGAGGQRSSAFQSALGRAGGGLEESLAALRSQIGFQGQQASQGQNQALLSSLFNVGMQPSFENTYFPGQTGLIPGAASGGIQGLLKSLPMLSGLFGGQ